MNLTFATEHNMMCSFNELLLNDRTNCFVYINNEQVPGIHGRDAVFFQHNEKTFKVFLNNDIETEFTLRELQKLNLSIFPSITCVSVNKDFIELEMEKVEKREPTNQDKYQCVLAFNNHMLYPEDAWDKPKNMFGSKIIDFHRCKFNPTIYSFPTNKSPSELELIHNRALQRYKAMDGKWKGTIYQTFKFNNGYTLPGYSSDNKIGDNYHKLPFLSLQKVKGENVLDLGCNQGWYSQIASLSGAKSVVGVDLCKEDLMLAKELNEHENIEFRYEDVTKYIKETKKTFDMVFLLSVLHQVYKQMEGSDEFLRNIANKTNYFIYETPIRHSFMKIPSQQIKNKLQEYFSYVRHMYDYNDYTVSGGARSLYFCEH